MPISIIVLTLVLLAVASVLWFAVRDARGSIGKLGRVISVVGFVAATVVFVGAATATVYGAPFGVEALKPPYNFWIERFERPVQPYV